MWVVVGCFPCVASLKERVFERGMLIMEECMLLPQQAGDATQ